MKLNALKMTPTQQGYALLLVVLFAGVSLTILASTLSWTTGSSKVTERNNSLNRAVAAAEAGTEAVMARMDRDFINQSLNYANLGAYRAVTPNSYLTNDWPTQYEFSDNNGRTDQAGLTTAGPSLSTNVDPNLPGLYGQVLACQVVSAAKAVG